MSYLETQVRDFLPTLDEEILEMIPVHCYMASTAMNIAFAEKVAELAGVRADPLFRQHRSRNLAEKLLSHLSGVTESGCVGDRLVTNAWAKELGLERWYEWVRLHAR